MTDAPSPTAALPAPDIQDIRGRFAEHYPRIHRIATYEHRRLYGDRHDDAVENTIAWAWWAYRKMALDGRDPDRLLDYIVRYSASRVRSEQLLGGKPHVNDVMSRRGRVRHGHSITSLPNSEDEETAAIVHDALSHPGPGPAEEAAWRVDYADWLASLSPKQRLLVEALEHGYTPTEIAERRGVSHQAVADMRRTLERKWDERGR